MAGSCEISAQTAWPLNFSRSSPVFNNATPLLCTSCGFNWSPLRLVGWTNIDTGAIVDFQAKVLAGINFSMASQLVNGWVFPFSSKFCRSLFVSASISNRKQNFRLFELKLLDAKQNHHHVIMHHQGSYTTHVQSYIPCIKVFNACVPMKCTMQTMYTGNFQVSSCSHMNTSNFTQSRHAQWNLWFPCFTFSVSNDWKSVCCSFWNWFFLILKHENSWNQKTNL